MKIFVDTGVFYAKYVPRDDLHAIAVKGWDKVREDGMRCLTTNFVIAELVSLLVYRFGSAKALQAAREIYGSNVIEVVQITKELELAALKWLERFSDQKFSMTDAASFAFMEKEDLQTAFTFDSHFEIAGFGKLTV